MKNFTASKTRSVSVSRFGVALVFLLGAIYLVSAPQGPLYYQQLIVLAGLALLSTAFPLAWIILPRWHPVHRALAAHGDSSSIASRLNEEMARTHEVLDPFHFTESFLVYSPGYKLAVVPYDVISTALKEPSGGEDSVPVIVVHTKDGKTYRWHRTWIQGIFDADQVLLSVRKRARLI